MVKVCELLTIIGPSGYPGAGIVHLPSGERRYGFLSVRHFIILVEAVDQMSKQHIFAFRLLLHDPPCILDNVGRSDHGIGIRQRKIFAMTSVIICSSSDIVCIIEANSGVAILFFIPGSPPIPLYPRIIGM